MLKDIDLEVLLLLWPFCPGQAKLMFPTLLLCSELLERDLERFFFGFSIAVDLDRGLPIFGKTSTVSRLVRGMQASPESLRSRRALGEGELDRMLAGDTRSLCLFKLKSVFKNGLEQEPLKL